MKYVEKNWKWFKSYPGWIKVYPGYIFGTFIIGVVIFVVILYLSGRLDLESQAVNRLAVASLVLAVLSILYAIYTNINSNKKFDRIQEITDEIADCTRTPLSDICDVLHKIYEMFCEYEDAVKGGKQNFEIWFLGFTLGLGFAHQVDHIAKQWEEKNKFTEDFNTFTKYLHRVLASCINSAKKDDNVHCYCLDHDNGDIENRFVIPLYEERYSKYNYDITIRNENTKKLKEYHNHIKNAILFGNKKGFTKTETVPLQVIVTTVKKTSGELRKAVIVFNVGALNVGTAEVAGFYSESEYLCNMFKDYIKSLALAESSKKRKKGVASSDSKIMIKQPSADTESSGKQPSSPPTTTTPTDEEGESDNENIRFHDAEYNKHTHNPPEDTVAQQADDDSDQVSQWQKPEEW